MIYCKVLAWPQQSDSADLGTPFRLDSARLLSSHSLTHAQAHQASALDLFTLTRQPSISCMCAPSPLARPRSARSQLTLVSWTASLPHTGKSCTADNTLARTSASTSHPDLARNAR